MHAHLHTVVTFCFQILLTSVRKEFRKRDQTNSIEEVEREVQQQIIETLQLGTYVECLIWYGYHWTRTSNDILLQRHLVLLWVFNDHNLISSCFFRESDSRNIAITRVVSIKEKEDDKRRGLSFSLSGCERGWWAVPMRKFAQLLRMGHWLVWSGLPFVYILVSWASAAI